MTPATTPTFKITIIGAGSVGFTKKLVSDILKVREFAGVEIALTDISAHNLGMIEQIIRRIVEVNRLPTRITATTDRRAALEGARYVMSCVRIGGLEAFADDIRIPLKYGVDQCVGDTICAGGIMYGQRGIPAMLDFCKDIREVAETGVRFLNYANPMAMMTWAAIEHGGVETIGLCHGVQNGWRQIAKALGIAPHTNLRSSAPASTTRPGTSASTTTAARSPATSWSRPSNATRSTPSRRRSASMS